MAIESAAVTLIKTDLRGVAQASGSGSAVMRNVCQNLFFSFTFDAAGITIAAGVFSPLFELLLSPIIAGAALASTVAAVGNALRLQSVRL